MTSNQGSKKIKTLVIGIIFLTGLMPLVLHWLFIGNVPVVDAPGARSLLSKPEANTVLVDVRDGLEFFDSHLEGAVSWPYDAIQTIQNTDQIPNELRDRTLLFLCNSGIMSVSAARKTAEISSQPVYSVRGGMQEWFRRDKPACPPGSCQLINSRGEAESFPIRRMSLFSQWAASIAAFGIKPAYMLLSLILAIVLRKATAWDLVALHYGFISFFLGEACCAVNYLFFHENSYLVEYLHMFGMVLAFGFVTYSLIEGINLRVIRHRDKSRKCAALELCGECYKYQEVSCKVRLVFLFLAPLMMVLCFIPLLALPHSDSYDADILGTLYNYTHPVVYQIFEIYYAPAAALIWFLLTFLLVLKTPGAVAETAEVFFAAGMGFIGFSLLRFVLFAAYRDNLWWFVIWEEITELLLIVGTGFFLWIFRQGLFREKSRTGEKLTAGSDGT